MATITFGTNSASTSNPSEAKKRAVIGSEFGVLVNELGLSAKAISRIFKDSIPERIENTPEFFKSLDDVQLGAVLTAKLTTEQQLAIQNMALGLKPKLDKLLELKLDLIQKFPQVREDVMELKLSRALAKAKKEFGSSLHMQAGQLACVQYLSEDLSNIDEGNFGFLASFSQEPKTLEVMILENGLRELIRVSNNILLDIPSNLILEAKRRINGEKPLPKDALDKVFF